MLNLLVFLVAFGFAQTQSPAPSGSVKSSAIPDRREFPVNPQINPCDDFYGYVCSKVIDSFQLREDRSAHDFAFHDSAERILKKKMDYFKTLATRDTKSPREESLKNYYLGCMNEKGKAKDEKGEVRRLKKIFAGFKTREAWENWIGKTYLSPEVGPLSWGTDSNMDHPLQSDLYLTTDFLTLPERSYYKKPEVMADFRKVVESFFKTIGESHPDKKADVVIKFESALTDVFPLPEQFREIVNNRIFITRDKLKERIPNLKVDRLLAEVPEATIIRDWIPDAMKYLNTYVGTASLDDLRTLFLFEALYGTLDDSQPAFYQEKFAFNNKHLGGPNKRPERQERCTRQVMSTFTKELDSILLPEMFPNFPREKFTALAEKIRGSLLKSLERNTWLSDGAKKAAIEKMKVAKLYLIAPETDKQWDFLPDGKYSPKTPLQNIKTVTALEQAKNLRDLREEQDPGRWGMGPLTINAYYSASHNKFVLPVGILQYPFYDPNQSDDQNLGAVGSVMGHELGHGVDDQGSRYDSQGKQNPWMTEKDLGEFSKRANLLISQFDAAGMNGHLTLGENIGDLVGVTASFDAASEDPKFHKDRERMKSFFEAWGRLWCEVKRPKYIENQIKTDPHSIGPARTNEQVKQQPAFQEAFQCKSSDKMILPKDKLVHIW